MMDFTVADVLAWARTKPADERYRYSDVCNCAVGQFARHVGIDLHGEQRCRLERLIGPYILDTAYLAGERRFGDLVAVLEKHFPTLAATPVTKSDWLTIDAYLTETVSA